MDELGVLESLVRAYSPSGHEGPAVARFFTLARKLGYRARVDAAGNGRAERGTGRPEVMFLGHIDTVDGRRPVRRVGRTVHGRGAVDAKGAIAAALCAGREFEGPGRWVVVAAVGEETDSRGARYLARHSAPDALIAGEPSGWDGLALGYKGELRAVASFEGTRTHYSSPTPTAGDRAVAWAERVRGRYAGTGDPSPFRSVTAKVVGLEFVPSGDVERARVEVDLRLPPGRTPEEVVAEWRADPDAPRIEVRLAVPPVEVDRANPVVRALEAGIRAEGARPTLWRKGGTSDLNVVLGRWRVPAAVYGPGDARLDHTARERISAEELERATRVLRHALGVLTTGSSTAPR